MREIPCRRVRATLADAVAGRPIPHDDAAWEVLLARGAVSGGPATPTVTAIGQHVLAELEVRADRVDDLPLDTVADQLARVAGDLDHVAKTAEYFLADLGPLTPPEALPLLRPVAVELANRRETPEELAEEFRNVWGAVEVMGGDSRDRLLAAELLTAADASMEALYAPLMSTTGRLRERFGDREAAVTPATLLHLHLDPGGQPALDAYAALRKAQLSPEEAALLAGADHPVPEVLAARAAALEALTSAGVRGPDTAPSATFLVAHGAPLPEMVARVHALKDLLANRVEGRVGPAALLSPIDWLQPPEIVNWVDKALGTARARRLAPSDIELGALAVALVHGLPRTEFAGPAAPLPSRARSAAILLAHAWVYRSLIFRRPGPPGGPTPRAA